MTNAARPSRAFLASGWPRAKGYVPKEDGSGRSSQTLIFENLLK